MTNQKGDRVKERKGNNTTLQVGWRDGCFTCMCVREKGEMGKNYLASPSPGGGVSGNFRRQRKPSHLCLIQERQGVPARWRDPARGIPTTKLPTVRESHEPGLPIESGPLYGVKLSVGIPRAGSPKRTYPGPLAFSH